MRKSIDNRCGNPYCNKINSGIDECIKPLIDALNNSGFDTVASCCGHGHRPGTIALKDGSEIIIAPDFESARKIEPLFTDIHGENDHRKDSQENLVEENKRLREFVSSVAECDTVSSDDRPFVYVKLTNEAKQLLTELGDDE